MRTKLFIGWAIVLSAFACGIAQAQERRTIPVTVVAKDGKIVEGLTAANFRARTRKKGDAQVRFDELSVNFVTLGSSSYIVMVDTSASSRGDERRWNCQWDVAAAALAELSRDSVVGLVTFGNSARLWGVWDPSQPRDMDKILKEIKNETTGRGQTAFYDSLVTVKSYGENTPSFGGIVLITDAVDNASSTGWKKMVRMFRGGPPVLSIQPPLHPDDSPTQYRTGTTLLERLAKESGGATDRLSKRQLSNGCADQRTISFIGTLRRAYEVTFELSEDLEQETKWSLEVVDANGKKMKGVTVHYPRYLVPLVAPQPE